MTNTKYANQQLLDDIHVLLELILGEFDRVCRSLDIPYCIYGGTAIGAVRHKGFIPWDDDADVLMRRSDYQRFLAQAPKILDSRFALHNTDTVADFPFMFTKMVLLDTLLIPKFSKNSRYKMPFFLDILPVDNIPGDRTAFNSMSRASWLWGRLLFLRGIARPYLVGVSGAKKALIYSATTLVHWSMRLTGIKTQFLQKQWEKAVRRYELTPCEYMADFTMRDPQNWVISHAELLPTIDMPFESLNLKMPAQYDTWLRRGYGDYMQLPPPEQQRNHNPYVVDFGPYKQLVENRRRNLS